MPVHISPDYSLSSNLKIYVTYQEEKISAGSCFQEPLTVFQLTVLKFLFCEPTFFHTFSMLPVT